MCMCVWHHREGGWFEDREVHHPKDDRITGSIYPVAVEATHLLLEESDTNSEDIALYERRA